MVAEGDRGKKGDRMDQHLQSALRVLSQSQDRLQNAILELMRMFPGVANGLAWQDKIFTEQRKYLSGPKDAHDYQLEIALRWVKLANEGRLQATMDARGLSVMEIDDAVLAPADLERILFKKLNELSGLKGLMYPELYTAVQHFLGLSLKQHIGVLEAVLKDLAGKRYLRYDVLPGGQLRINQALNFDEWRDMMVKPQSPSVTNNSFTFNDQVGAVQTGAGSVANVQQAAVASPYADLKSALQSVLQELGSSNLPLSKRQEAEDYIDKTVQEIDSEKPNKAILTALCSGLATTIQTLGSASAAYTAVTAALAHLGISFG